MTMPLFTNGPVAIIERARTVLTDGAQWTALLAAYTTQRSLEYVIGPQEMGLAFQGPVIEQPKDLAIEAGPIDEDTVRPPQRFPAVRLMVLDSATTYGVNAGAANTEHTLEVRTFTKVVAQSVASTGLKWTMHNQVMVAEFFALAVRYLLEQGLVNATDNVFNVVFNGVSSKGIVAAGDTTMYRVVANLSVFQRTRSGRFNYPLTDA